MRQIIVPVSNRPGMVADVSQALADAEVNIEDIDAEASVSNGVIILRVDHYDTAVRALSQAGFRPITEDALVLRLKNQPGALAEVAQRLKDAQINIRSLRIVRRREEDCLATLVTDHQDAAKSLLAKQLVTR